MQDMHSINNTDRFNGQDYQPLRDDIRLTGQLLRIWGVVRRGDWLSLDRIATLTGDPQASISAQLRHLRKRRFGSHEVEKKHVGAGLYLYRVLPNNESLVR